MTNSDDLGPVSVALRQEPGFLAGWLSATPGGERWIAERFALSDPSLHRLLTCRAPRPQRFLADVSAIASYVGVDPTALATALREAAVLAALGSRDADVGDSAGRPGLLAAARDTAAEQLPEPEATTGVRELAEDTWRAAPAEIRARRDVEAALVWASPVIVVSVPRLHLALANRWLADHGVPHYPTASANFEACSSPGAATRPSSSTAPSPRRKPG